MKSLSFSQKNFLFLIFVLLLFLSLKGLETVIYLGDHDKFQKIKIDQALLKIKPAINKEIASSRLVSSKKPRVNPTPKELKDADIILDQQLLPSTLRRQLKGAKSGIIFDVDRKAILWQKNANKSVGIASMTKMMTCLLVLEEVSQGKIKLKNQYRVCKSATMTKPSWVALKTGDVVSTEELCKALMVKSANDAAKQLAMIVSGSEKIFVRLMNIRAKRLGMKQTKFYNPNGLTQSDRLYNKASALDMIKLSYRLLQYKDAVRWASMKTAEFTTQFRTKNHDILYLRNHNNILWRFEGTTGMKTGFTNIAGFCTTVTCKRNGRRVIIVLTGVSSSKERDHICLSALRWFYSHTVN
jgi:D-alanyl-D-alanine carboxypeptidase (penicillin-binding protein 5/6)